MTLSRPSLFTSGRPVRSSLFDTSSSQTSVEVDLRAQLDELFFGYSSGVRHGYPVVIRRMRRDAHQKPIPCTCFGEFTREPDPDCSFCAGEGYLNDAEWFWTFSMYDGSKSGMASKIKYIAPGAIRVDEMIFFFRYDNPIRYGDKIVQVKLDEEGQVIVPNLIEAIYKPATINKHRSDNGRIEYFTVHCREEDAIRPDEF